MEQQGRSPKQYKDSAMIVFYGFIIGWIMFLICALTSS
jgi:hypothetical protein